MNGSALHATGEATRPLRRTDVHERELDGEALVYDPRTADTHLLNPTARMIWHACDGRSDETAITAKVVEAFLIDEGDARAHVAAALATLRERGLLESPG